MNQDFERGYYAVDKWLGNGDIYTIVNKIPAHLELIEWNGRDDDFEIIEVRFLSRCDMARLGVRFPVLLLDAFGYWSNMSMKNFYYWRRMYCDDVDAF